MSDLNDLSKTEEEIEEKLRKLQLTETQRKFFDQSAEILAKVLEMPLISTRGFLTMAFVENQRYQKTTIAEQEARDDIRKLTQEELVQARIVNVTKVFNEFKTKIKKVLQVKNKEHLLDKAVKDALKNYTDNYVSRPPDVKEK